MLFWIEKKTKEVLAQVEPKTHDTNNNIMDYFC